MRFIAVIFAAFVSLAPLAATAASPTPVLVELFTSEGCSSCPPADNVLAQLSKQQPLAGIHIIALSEHVDYWDNYGWVDRFSSHQFTNRQQRYAQVFGRNTVYTPQMVVSGQRQFVGSYRSRAISAIKSEARTAHTPIKLALSHASGADQATADVRIDARNLPHNGARADVWLAVTEDNLHTDVRGGENGGSRLDHTAVVRRLMHIGSVSNDAHSGFSRRVMVPVSAKWWNHGLHVVVFAQNSSNLHVLGATSQVLHPG